MATLADLMNNMAQGKAYKNATYKDFIPDFLNEKPKGKSLKQQEDEDRAFGAKLLELQARAKGA